MNPNIYANFFLLFNVIVYWLYRCIIKIYESMIVKIYVYFAYNNSRNYYYLDVWLCFVGETLRWFPRFPDGFFGELWVRENSRNSSFKLLRLSLFVIEAICLSSWHALIAWEKRRVLEAVGRTGLGLVASLEDVVVVVAVVSFDVFVANLSKVSFRTPLLCVSFDINFSLSDRNRRFSSTKRLTGAGTSTMYEW